MAQVYHIVSMAQVGPKVTFNFGKIFTPIELIYENQNKLYLSEIPTKLSSLLNCFYVSGHRRHSKELASSSEMNSTMHMAR